MQLLAALSWAPPAVPLAACASVPGSGTLRQSCGLCACCRAANLAAQQPQRACSRLHLCAFCVIARVSNTMVSTDLASPLLATERTFLAWTRTCLALVGAALVAAKFFGGFKGARIAAACFLLALVFLGFATFRYFDTVDKLKAGTFEVDNAGPIVVVASVTLAIAAGIAFTFRWGSAPPDGGDDTPRVALLPALTGQALGGS